MTPLSARCAVTCFPGVTMAKVSAIQSAAERIAPRLSRSVVGFDPLTILTIITTLLPLLASCFKRDESDTDPQEFLRANFNPATGQFKDRLVRRCRPNTRKSARKTLGPKEVRRMTPDQIDEITHQALLEGMTAPPKAVAACLAEAE